jgi:nicotinate-nucleotide--dimethylbenzimidazole phosphoribosyltransferase
MVSGLPFDDIRELMASLPRVDEAARNLADQRSGELANRFSGLFGIGPVADWLAGWSGHSPMVQRPMVAIFAGTHQVLDSLPPDSQIPGEKTLVSVTRMAAGGAPVNQVCAANDIGLKVFDLALQLPVKDITTDDALDEKACAATIGFGMEAIAGGVDLLCLSGLGQGSEVANLALALLFEGEEVISGKDIPSPPIVQLAKAAAATHHGGRSDPLELLRRLGGREHAALAGAILAARTGHIPVVLDGLTALSVALLLERQTPGSCDHCRLASSGTDGLFHRLAIGFPAILQELPASDDCTSGALAVAHVKSLAAVHSGTVIDEE